MLERRGPTDRPDAGIRTRVEDWLSGQATPQFETQSVSTYVLRWRDYAYGDRKTGTEPIGASVHRRVHRSAA
jgi:hypothetical protein